MHVLITAGPTREPIDTVRFISNRSSGRLGLALADSAADRGHDVTLLLGPVLIPTTLKDRLRVHRFQTTAELQGLLHEHFPACDTLVMAAAVADYRPLTMHQGKRARSEAEGGNMRIELEPTPDLIGDIAPLKQPFQRTVAFALEEQDNLETRARRKMQRKGVDAMVANPLTTMDDASITPIWLTPEGNRQAPGSMPKAQFAPWLIDRIESLGSPAKARPL